MTLRILQRIRSNETDDGISPQGGVEGWSSGVQIFIKLSRWQDLHTYISQV